MATEFDLNQLEAITGGDAEFEREILEEYLASAPRDLQKLKNAIVANDATATGACAHALKGASATIGAKGFAALALGLEQAGKKADLSNAAAQYANLEGEFAQLADYLRKRLPKAA